MNKNFKIALFLSLFFLLGITIRIYNLGDHNLWFDEFHSLLYSRYLSLKTLFVQVQAPLYFVLLRFWMNWFGSTEFALRFLSAMFSLLSIPLIYKVGKLFFDKEVGLISAFILSISPLHIWYSQEARNYTLSTFLIILTVYLFILALRINKVYLWIGFIISSILAIYSGCFSFFIIFATGGSLFLKNYRHRLKQWWISLCFILLAFSPWLPILLKRAIQIKDIFWIPKPPLKSIIITFENFNVGYNATVNIYLLTSIIFFTLFILGVMRWKRERESLIFLITFLFVPIISTFFISQWMPIYLDRQLMLFSPFYYIIVAAGLAKIRIRIIKPVLYCSISLSILICLNNYFSYRMPVNSFHHIGVHVKRPVKPATDYINSRFRRGDVIAFPGYSIINIWYYIPRGENFVGFIIESKADKYWYKVAKNEALHRLQKGLKPRFIILGPEKSSIPGARNIEECNFKRIWLISSSWARDGNLSGHAKAVKEWMRTNYLLLDSREFDGIFIDLYVRDD